MFRFDVREANLDSADLTIELHASNDDAWSPEHVIVWGISGRVGDERVIPLAAFLDLASPLTPADGGVWISTDTSEGERILFVPSVGRGTTATRARRLIVISATDAYPRCFLRRRDQAVTSKRLERTGPSRCKAAAPGDCSSLTRCRPRRRAISATAEAGSTSSILAAPFSRQDLEGGAFTLTIGSDDWWKPRLLRGIGVDTVNGGPRALIPFVAASAFELRQMSSDPAEGFHSMVLPTAKVLPQLTLPPDAVDPDDLGGVLAAKGVAHPENRGPRAGGALRRRRRRRRRNPGVVANATLELRGVRRYRISPRAPGPL